MIFFFLKSHIKNIKNIFINFIDFFFSFKKLFLNGKFLMKLNRRLELNNFEI